VPTQTKMFKPGTPVTVSIRGKSYEGYYQGLARWEQCHRVTARRAKGSADWIICDQRQIERDYRNRAKEGKSDNVRHDGIFE
jgi:hypothetical protein